ncbi:unnamed protein product, partial [Closterium sp. NIES-53]
PGGLLVTWQAKHSKEVLGPAYIKFNSNSKTCQVSPYQTGTFRGVIVQVRRMCLSERVCVSVGGGGAFETS